MDKREVEAIQREALSGKSGVYAIFNEQAGKIYIGSAINIWDRWNRHKRDLRANKHHCHHLQRSWNKYGEREFSFVIIEFCDSEIRLEREQYYLDMYKDKDKRDLVYNETLNAKASFEGVTGENHPMYGKHHTEETKKKIKESLKGKNMGINNHNYGKHFSEETKKKMSESRMGKYTGELNPFAKRLYMYDENYILIKEFGAISDCVRFLLDNKIVTTKAKNPINSVNKCIRRTINLNKPYKGFIFSYEPIKKSA